MNRQNQPDQNWKHVSFYLRKELQLFNNTWTEQWSDCNAVNSSLDSFFLSQTPSLFFIYSK